MKRRGLERNRKEYSRNKQKELVVTTSPLEGIVEIESHGKWASQDDSETIYMETTSLC